jgi:DGQHR domain-containing protein
MVGIMRIKLDVKKKVPAILVRQKDRNLLVFSIEANELLNMCYFNPREIDREKGIQRNHKVLRSKQIAKFIDSEAACLANNIIINFELAALGLKLEDVYSTIDHTLNIEELKSRANICKGKRPVPLRGKCAFVIDGQHRLRAFKYAKNVHFPLIVTALIDRSLAEVAELFIQINYNQKPINKSLAYDLLGISGKIFPEYQELHDLVKRLNNEVDSPFYSRVKMLGVGKGVVSQASLITAIEKYRVRETLTEILGIKPTVEVLYNVIWQFFSSVSTVFHIEWAIGGKLSRTIGTRALFLVMIDLLKLFHEKGREFSAAELAQDLRNVNISKIFQQKGGFGGEKGVKELSKLILSDLGISV